MIYQPISRRLYTLYLEDWGMINNQTQNITPQLANDEIFK